MTTTTTTTATATVMDLCTETPTPTISASAFRSKTTIFIAITPAPSAATRHAIPSAVASALRKARQPTPGRPFLAAQTADFTSPLPHVYASATGATLVFADQSRRWAAHAAAAGWLAHLARVLSTSAAGPTTAVLSERPAGIMLDVAPCYPAFLTACGLNAGLVAADRAPRIDLVGFGFDAAAIVAANRILENKAIVRFTVPRVELRPGRTAVVWFHDAEFADFFVRHGGLRWPGLPGVVLRSKGLLRCRACKRTDHEEAACAVPKCTRCGWRGDLGAHVCRVCEKCGRTGHGKDTCRQSAVKSRPDVKAAKTISGGQGKINGEGPAGEHKPAEDKSTEAKPAKAGCPTCPWRGRLEGHVCRMCPNCGRIGHSKEFCWNLTRKPINHSTSTPAIQSTADAGKKLFTKVLPTPPQADLEPAKTIKLGCPNCNWKGRLDGHTCWICTNCGRKGHLKDACRQPPQKPAAADAANKVPAANVDKIPAADKISAAAENKTPIPDERAAATSGPAKKPGEKPGCLNCNWKGRMDGHVCRICENCGRAGHLKDVCRRPVRPAPAVSRIMNRQDKTPAAQKAAPEKEEAEDKKEENGHKNAEPSVAETKPAAAASSTKPAEATPRIAAPDRPSADALPPAPARTLAGSKARCRLCGLRGQPTGHACSPRPKCETCGRRGHGRAVCRGVCEACGRAGHRRDACWRKAKAGPTWADEVEDAAGARAQAAKARGLATAAAEAAAEGAKAQQQGEEHAVAGAAGIADANANGGAGVEDGGAVAAAGIAAKKKRQRRYRSRKLKPAAIVEIEG